MVNQAQFEFIKKKYGHYASWAIWADEKEKPKDNMDDLSIFDINKNTNLLEQLNPNIVLVGLNISQRIEKPLANFHGAGGGAYKIRYSLRNSPFWGAYMTDIIKDFEQKSAGKMMSYLRKNSPFEKENIMIFREELHDLGVTNPTIIAFGKDTLTILNRNFKDEFKILGIPHYSKYIGKEKYREEVQSILNFK